jgi:hypothetical protein
MWTTPVSDDLQRELQAALARPHASWVDSPRPVSLTTGDRVVGWLWGRMHTEAGVWLGLATLFHGNVFEGAELGWWPAEQLRTLG